VFYAAYLTAVELDGTLAHPGETRWQDIGRDNAATADGIFTLRYGYLDLTVNPCQVAAQVATVLGRRGFSGARPCSPGCPVIPAQALAAPPSRQTGATRPGRPNSSRLRLTPQPLQPAAQSRRDSAGPGRPAARGRTAPRKPACSDSAG
jgi:hypothetical protein